MLFDDDDQLEVRHVVSLAHHNVSIYSGGDETPEGELFIKRNAICLSRKTDVGGLTPDGGASKPFFLFSENCSDKEDFYFALLRNQERRLNAKDNPPVPLKYDVNDIITLVQRLHSSEEHLQTRWINAVIGRVFLALYKTPEVENFVRAKINKKISRVKTPSFLSKIVLRNIDMGEAAPVITNPRLKDLTVDGELIVEADVRYTGNFRIEVAATARIDLGTRIKAREVNLLLAVVLKKIEGHVMVRVKPPPSNRLWFTFQSMPKIDMAIEPIVSSRQITYTLILRQIENRIKEVVAESLVFPNWDDSPFYHTENRLWRGGIWADDGISEHTQGPETAATQDGDVNQVHHPEAEQDEAISTLSQVEKSISMPLVDTSSSGTAFPRKAARSAMHLGGLRAMASSTSVETQPCDKPKALRSGSFASASSPSVSTDVSHADTFKNSTPPEHSHAATAMAAISALSQTNLPAQTPVRYPSRPSRTEKAGSESSVSSRDSMQSEDEFENDLTPQPSLSLPDPTNNLNAGSYPPSPVSMSNTSFSSQALSAKSLASFGNDPRRENPSPSSGKSSAADTKRLSLTAVTNAAATAKKWGWNAIQRHGEPRTDSSSRVANSPSQPLVMGRGRPLPPPGTPLPPPDRKSKTAPVPVPKRKPIPPSALPLKQKDPELESNGVEKQHTVSTPPLPKRPSREDADADGTDDGLLVVAAPTGDSEPTTPISEDAPICMPPWVGNAEETGPVQQTVTADGKDVPVPTLSKRRPPHRVLSSSPEEDGPELPSWMAAQEEEARAKSTFVDEDTGL
jgi:hypothetical protein